MEENKKITGTSENIIATIGTSSRSQASEEQKLLQNLKIGISISNSPDLEKLGYSSTHLEDTIIEFGRYLLIYGGTIIYGGDLREKGYTYLFSELPRLYSLKEQRNDFRFINYFAWPIHLQLTEEKELDFKQKKVKVIKLPPPDSIKNDVNELAFLERKTIESKIIYAKSYSYMRNQMNKDCGAKIFLGGLVTKFHGKYPGIMEEAVYALEKEMPVYLVGAFGGATAEMIKLICGKDSEKINKNYQLQDKDYKEFYDYWNDPSKNKNEEAIDYVKLADFFKTYGLEKICRNNGLTEEENKILFSTSNLREMIYYVLKGLSNI